MMPNRLLKEGITDSPKIDLLKWEEEVFFYRMLVTTDDLGRFDARPALLRSRCFPLKEPSTLPNNLIESWLNALQRAELIHLYVIDGETFGEVANWDQRVRSKGKYPEPMGCCWLTLDGQLTDVMPSLDRNVLPNDGLGKGKGLGKGASSRIALDADDWQGISADDMALWAKAFPAINIDAELAKAAAWIRANPKNRKSNYARFLTSWFSRTQDRAPRVDARNHAGTGEAFRGAL